MNSCFLTPLKEPQLRCIFNEDSIKIINDLLITATYFQPPRISFEQNLPVYISKENIEQFMVQALGAEPCGAGSNFIDIIDRKRGFGADIKMLTCQAKGHQFLKTLSGETSLAQRFTDTNLDAYFNAGAHDAIKDIWINTLKTKYSSMKDEKLKKIYYFFILRAGLSFYLTGCLLNIGRIDNFSVIRTTNSSAFLGGVIDPSFGEAKIYKAKKRLELRLIPSAWQEKYCIEFNQASIEDPVRLKDLDQKSYRNYWEKRVDSFSEKIL